MRDIFSPQLSRTGHSMQRARARLSRFGLCLLFLIPVMPIAHAHGQMEPNLAELRQSFAHPPDNCRIMVRWWWFGPAVTKAEIQRELEQMKEAGIGGVEVATLYPLALDDPATGFRNLPFLSDEHLDDLRYASEEASRLGLRFDITLGSGWPFGGPHIPVTEAAGELRVETVAVPPDAQSVATPNLSAGESLIAAFIVPGHGDKLQWSDARLVSRPVIADHRLQLTAASGNSDTAIFFISSRTGMTVKRPAIGAEGFVLDPYDPNAIATHLRAVGDKMLGALADHPPYAVFSDSLEVYGSDWTPAFLQQFQQLRGYDLTPHLLSLIADTGPDTAAIRHDWAQTLTDLANQHYLQPLREWARQHHTLFRSQTYGFPPVTLSSNQYEDLPEGEGKATMLMWREFSDTWAASAGHLFGKPVISSETWTWLNSPAFRATPLDMKAEADLHFLQGINQLVGHGWPYSPPMAGEPGWRMYAAGAFNAHNPWWFAMPDVAKYLQRVSFAMRQGQPANDVALFLPNDDAWAGFSVPIDSTSPVANKHGFNTRGEDLSIDESMSHLLGTTVIPQVLDAGFNLDFIDGDAIDSVGIRHPVLILPGVERIPVDVYQKIEQYAQHGGIVIATRRLPSTAPGLMNAERDSKEIQNISARLFRGKSALGHFLQNEDQLGRALADYLKPDVLFSPATPSIGFLHRHLEAGDLYFIANTSNQAQTVEASFRSAEQFAERWDPFSGEISPVANPAHLQFQLQPYESRLIFFTNVPLQSGPRWISGPHSTKIDLSADWTLTFANSQTMHMSTLHSWADQPNHRYYSGQVSYEKTFDLPARLPREASVVLDFGEGTPVPIPDPLPAMNMRAYFEGPIREAAEVYINGQRAGVVWHPPYTIDLTPYAKPGKNELRILVGNTAINELAGRSLPDYRLLYDRYGERFVPQGMEHLQPLPSGILGPVTVRITPRHREKVNKK